MEKANPSNQEVISLDRNITKAFVEMELDPK